MTWEHQVRCSIEVFCFILILDMARLSEEDTVGFVIIVVSRQEVVLS